METRTVVAVGVTVGVLVVAAVAVGLLSGAVPSGGNGGHVAVPTATGSATPYAASGSDAPFQMRVDSIDPCGRTCRDVTATLVNGQSRRATGVTVYTQIYAGNTTDGDPVWSGSQDVGTLDPGAAATNTTRVDLGLMDAAKVQQHGGHITVRLTVDTDRRTVRFVEHRDVS